jgi:hypothetical protein
MNGTSFHSNQLESPLRKSLNVDASACGLGSSMVRPTPEAIIFLDLRRWATPKTLPRASPLQTGPLWRCRKALENRFPKRPARSAGIRNFLFSHHRFFDAKAAGRTADSA